MLFRESSNLVCTYGSRIITLDVSKNTPSSFGSNLTNTNKDQIYSMKLKGISICFNILKWSLSGGYVNFGVFQLYNDNCLDNALQIFVKLLLCFQQNDLNVSYGINNKKLYQKTTYLFFIERFIQN